MTPAKLRAIHARHAYARRARSVALLSKLLGPEYVLAPWQAGILLRIYR